MSCTFGALKGNSIRGAKREFMALPIYDNEVVNSFGIDLHIDYTVFIKRLSNFYERKHRREKT